MATRIELVDHEFLARRRRQRRIQFAAALACLGLFIYPEWKDYQNKWAALTGARKLASYLNILRSQAIISKTPIEARFRAPDAIEVFQVGGCGPSSNAEKISERKLSEFGEDLVFPPEEWVKKDVFPLQEGGDRFAGRYCYDPLYGSSLHADGVATASFFVVNAESLREKRADHVVRVMFAGASGDISFF